LDDATWSWSPEGHPDGFFGGDCGIDGPGLYQRNFVLRRAGRAVIELNEDGSLRAAIFGHLPGRFPQVAGAAEVFAYLQLMHHSQGFPPSRIVTDYQGLVEGLARGRRWCVSEHRKLGAVWHEVWVKLDDMGGGVWPAIWTKAHRKRSSVAGNPELERLWLINHEADAHAKLGAAKHPVNDMLICELDRQAKVARMVALLAAKAIPLWNLEDGDRARRRAGLLRPKGRRPRRRARRLQRPSGHAGGRAAPVLGVLPVFQAAARDARGRFCGS